MTPAVQSVSVVFPCYNDANSIEWVVDRAATALSELEIDFEVIVVNDGSLDHSGQVLESLGQRMNALRVITHPANRGYGGALRTGFGAATKQWIFYTDGDGQYDPDELHILVDRAAPEVDVVQGYKSRRSDNAIRGFVGRIYHVAVSRLFRLRLRDTDCDFRLIRSAMFQRFLLTHSSGAITVEMVRKLQDAGARFVEVPVSHYPRRYGESEFFHRRHIMATLIDLARFWARVMRGVHH
jgi:glycosyltransferase involved in cell wall biosynthesis